MSSATSGRDRLAERLQRDIRYLIAFSMLSNEQIARTMGINVVDQQTLGLMELAGRPLAAGEIAALVHLPSSTVTRVIDRLAAAGFVTRTADPADRRKVIVDVDRTKLATFFGDYAEHVDNMVDVNDGFTEEELQIVARYLEALRPKDAL